VTLQSESILDATRHSGPSVMTERDHRRISAGNRNRLSPGLPQEWPAEDLAREARQRVRERRMVDAARREIAATAPTQAEAFVSWFEALKESGPGQNDPLFPWLAEQATYEQMRWFLQQEVAGEAGFDDLLALTQIKMPLGPKLEMARNYWDEMGRGNPKGVHGSMLSTLSDAFSLGSDQEEVVWEALALGNVMIALSMHRCYAFHAVGALGAIELTAPTRAVFVARGLKRLGIASAQRHYFDLHAVLDVAHSGTWNREVLVPLVREQPEVAWAIAEGALLRLRCGERCFERYRLAFGLGIHCDQRDLLPGPLPAVGEV
jgi:Iron-containing redox enzyme